MKLKNSYFFTLRENQKNEDSISGNLLVRGGFIKKSSAGIYMILPLGKRVLDEIEKIIREELNAINCQELTMPCMISEDIFIKSGRRAGFGNSMFSLKDRFSKPYVLGPTHEELFALAGQMKIHSYKDLPFSLYQIQTKFRDEPRPRYGLIRVREFVMKDSYTFDRNEEELNISYQKQFNAYVNIMNRLQLDYKIVKADTGVMGGLLSEEFQAICDIGEDTLVLNEAGDYASNLEIAQCINEKVPLQDALPFEKVMTPNAKSIEEVSQFFNQPSTQFVKTLLYLADGEIVAALVRGNREVNETKLRKVLGVNEVILVSEEDLKQSSLKTVVGFVGPIGLNCRIIMDEEISYMSNFITGANEKDFHFKNVNTKDFKADIIADIRFIQENDLSPNGNGRVYFKKGIEVGNTFKLGTKYSEMLDLHYLDQNNQSQPVWMGSYGIGVGRCMAAIVEQNNDENGIIWPTAIAPYKLCIIPISSNDTAQVELSEKLYELFNKQYATLLDNRDERPGVKFKDMELIGIPLRIVVGKKAAEQIVEVKSRDGSINTEVSINELASFVDQFMGK